MSEKDQRRRYTANLQGEVDSASLYRTLSQTEKNAELAQVYARLGAVEEAHAEFWKRKIGAIGQRVPSLRPSFRTPPTAAFPTDPEWRRPGKTWLDRMAAPPLPQIPSGTYFGLADHIKPVRSPIG